MVKTTDLVADLRVCLCGECSACGHGCGDADCLDSIMEDVADRLEELVDRCARYAEEIAVLREKLKRMYGRWEPCFDENEHWRQGIGKCSECGQEFYAHAINRYNFCPMCGTKMGGGEHYEG